MSRINKEDNFKEFKDLLPTEIKHRLKKKYFEKRIIELFNSLLKGSISNHVKAIYIYKNEIYCGVDNPLWGNEIISYKDHYLKKLNKTLKCDIKGIRFKLIPSLFKEKEKHESKIDLSEEQKKEIDNLIRNVKDDTLKNKIHKLLAMKYINENLKEN